MRCASLLSSEQIFECSHTLCRELRSSSFEEQPSFSEESSDQTGEIEFTRAELISTLFKATSDLEPITRLIRQPLFSPQPAIDPPVGYFLTGKHSTRFSSSIEAGVRDDLNSSRHWTVQSMQPLKLHSKTTP
ncbi:hypothetical protein A6X21_10055 [Planctopirus hydrillae]|uniref:Uncharacterized protein n=1 Tax=Planctopirus hydrillae TaxID=1841610 RepID=A0A1C3E7D7_9PLAN|nr:hypothetical protein A6X21_10055 [Planctopirus hydrillae]